MKALASWEKPCDESLVAVSPEKRSEDEQAVSTVDNRFNLGCAR